MSASLVSPSFGPQEVSRSPTERGLDSGSASLLVSPAAAPADALNATAPPGPVSRAAATPPPRASNTPPPAGRARSKSINGGEPQPLRRRQSSRVAFKEPPPAEPRKADKDQSVMEQAEAALDRKKRQSSMRIAGVMGEMDAPLARKNSRSGSMRDIDALAEMVDSDDEASQSLNSTQNGARPRRRQASFAQMALSTATGDVQGKIRWVSDSELFHRHNIAQGRQLGFYTIHLKHMHQSRTWEVQSWAVQKKALFMAAFVDYHYLMCEVEFMWDREALLWNYVEGKIRLHLQEEYEEIHDLVQWANEQARAMLYEEDERSAITSKESIEIDRLLRAESRMRPRVQLWCDTKEPVDFAIAAHELHVEELCCRRQLVHEASSSVFAGAEALWAMALVTQQEEEDGWGRIVKASEEEATKITGITGTEADATLTLFSAEMASIIECEHDRIAPRVELQWPEIHGRMAVMVEWETRRDELYSSEMARIMSHEYDRMAGRCALQWDEATTRMATLIEWETRRDDLYSSEMASIMECEFNRMAERLDVQWPEVNERAAVLLSREHCDRRADQELDELSTRVPREREYLEELLLYCELHKIELMLEEPSRHIIEVEEHSAFADLQALKENRPFFKACETVIGRAARRYTKATNAQSRLPLPPKMFATVEEKACCLEYVRLMDQRDTEEMRRRRLTEMPGTLSTKSGPITAPLRPAKKPSQQQALRSSA